MGKKRKHQLQIEKRTENVRFLSNAEISSFNSWAQERRNALGEEILEILYPDEIEQFEAVMFNGLVDSYILAKKRAIKIIKYIRKKNTNARKQAGTASNK